MVPCLESTGIDKDKGTQQHNTVAKISNQMNAMLGDSAWAELRDKIPQRHQAS
jgi:hypothetical protein